jgi:hypothetical protein
MKASFDKYHVDCTDVETSICVRRWKEESLPRYLGLVDKAVADAAARGDRHYADLHFGSSFGSENTDIPWQLLCLSDAAQSKGYRIEVTASTRTIGGTGIAHHTVRVFFAPPWQLRK